MLDSNLNFFVALMLSQNDTVVNLVVMFEASQRCETACLCLCGVILNMILDCKALRYRNWFM